MLRDRVLLPLILIGVSGVSPVQGQTDQNPSFNKHFSRPSAQALLSVKNDLVAVQVRATNDTSAGGEISYAGVFNIGTANNLPLLFQFPGAPFSSHVNVRVDNIFYSNDPRRTNCNLLRLTFARVMGDSAIECSYQAGPIAVLQRLSPQKFSATTGAIFIEYVLNNTDPTNNHQAGVLLELDTFVNGNDQAPVLTNFGYSRFEQKFSAPQIPDFFQAFQIGNPADSTGLVAQGSLVGYNAVRPDQLIIGDWSRLSAVQWDYDVPASPPRYDDSAVILCWNEQNLAARQTRTISTYFGLGDVTTRRDAASGLTLHLTALRNLRAIKGQLTPNPFEVNLLVFNRANPSVNAVQAALILPPQLALASGDFSTKLLAPSNLSIAQNNGTSSWTVVAQCPAASLDVPLRVEVSGLVGTASVLAAAERPLFLPACGDFVPPYAVNFNPPRGAREVPLRAGISLEVQDDDSGVDPAALVLAINGAPVAPHITGTEKGYRLQYGPSSPWRDDQRIAVQLHARDMAIPPNVLADEYFFITVRDSLPPRALNFSPAPFAGGISPQTEISLQVEDDLTGVDFQSMLLQINGLEVQADSSHLANGYALRYRLATQVLRNDTVHVSIAAQDLASPPNAASFSYYFVLGQDRVPPFVAHRNPEAGAINVAADAEVSVTVVDLQSGVDQNSLIMEVNGQRVQPQILGDRHAPNLKYRPASPWSYESVVKVAVRAQDLAAPPNVMQADTFNFTITSPRPDLIAGDLQAAETFILGRPVKVKGKIQAVGEEVNQLFRIEYQADGKSYGDTTITALAAGMEMEVETRFRFDTPGTHIAEMIVDADNTVVESDENNNRRQLVINLVGTLANKLIVRPNPFTPNGDGYNDVVEFNFAGLNLDSPSLHIYDVNGVPVWINKPQTGKVYTWDGRNEDGRELQPGVYLYTLQERGSSVGSGFVVIAR